MKRINLLNDVNDFIYLLKNVNSLKFRKWFKYGLKAQKLLAQGIALGIMANSKTPCFTLIEQALSVFFNVNYI